MSEFTSTPDYDEIDSTAREQFINRVRELTPYDDQPISDFGTFKVSFEREDGYVDIYRPVFAVDFDEDDMIDDAYAVAVRREDELEDGHTVVRTHQYIVRATTMETDYSEGSLIIDPNGERIPVQRPVDVNEDINFYDAQAALGMNIFTNWRFREVMRILDELRAEDGFSL
jgi:hypothetical protein